MWTDSLFIEDLLSHRQTALAFDRARPVALIVGANGSGKTSTARVIELALTGEILGLRGTGYTLRDVIREGAPFGTVKLSAQAAAGTKPVEIRRRVAGKITTAVNGRPETKGVYDLFCRIKGGADPAAVFRVLTNVTGFFELAPEPPETARRQKALLVGLVDPSVPGDAFPAWPLTFGPVPTTFAGVAEADVMAAGRLTEIRRELDRLAVDPEALAGESVTETLIEEIRTRIKTVDAERTERIKAQGDVAARRWAIDQRARVLEEKRDGLGGKLDQWGSLEAARSTLAQARVAYQEAEASEGDRTVQLEALRVLEGRQTAAQEEYQRALDTTHVCPAGACPLHLDEKARAATVTDLDNRLSTLEQEIDAARLALLPALNLGVLRQTIARAEHLVRDIESATAQRAEALAELAALDTERTGLPAEDPEIATLDERLSRGRAALTDAQTAQERRTKAEQDTRARVKLQAEASAIESLRDLTGPTGLRERLLVERLGAVTDQVNRVLDHFGLVLTVTGDPWGVRIGGQGHALMSETEEQRAGFAFQIALAEATGSKILVADRIGNFDALNRDALFATLELGLSKGWIEQAILFATSTAPRLPTEAPAPFVALYHCTRPRGAATSIARVV